MYSHSLCGFEHLLWPEQGAVPGAEGTGVARCWCPRLCPQLILTLILPGGHHHHPHLPGVPEVDRGRYLAMRPTHVYEAPTAWHRAGLEDSWEGRGAGEALPSAHPMPAGPRRICPPRHTWEPAVVGLSGPGLSRGYLKTCCQPVLDRSGAPGALHPLGRMWGQRQGSGSSLSSPPKRISKSPLPHLPWAWEDASDISTAADSAPPLAPVAFLTLGPA